VNDLLLARATFAAAVNRWPGANHPAQRCAHHRPGSLTARQPYAGNVSVDLKLIDWKRPHDHHVDPRRGSSALRRFEGHHQQGDRERETVGNASRGRLVGDRWR
jgi:hypothetical protein